ncbi:ribosome recycling factor [Rapidithrix thailandica]|uniref:Ribosome-recycling factor n=1 Tax=Rapidithrix thailandica TaxID=413964 RepID=A0AAW9RR18_9BACT
MEEDIQLLLEETKDHMEKTVLHCEIELTKIRAGRAMPSMLDEIQVDYYGAPTPLSQVASITTPDARSLMIKPWEKNMVPEIEKAIKNSDLGLNPQNDGEVVRINIPPLTEERRKDLVKQAKHEAEHARISLRNVRKDANDTLKKMLKDGLAEDLMKKTEDDVQVLTNQFVKQIDEHLEKKEKDIMTV